ncbi:hereditary hemochromatosis protein homolog isoform X2 [Triplophysa rosa]|nr:hereditary hemochromatosis protein homolog isoform X2 [Triplophysa rosa]
MVDDVRVLYYNGDTKTFVRRGTPTNEDSVLDSNLISTISNYILGSFEKKYFWIASRENFNKTDSTHVLQGLVLCELNDDAEQGQMVTRNSFQGFTTDELRYIDNNFSYECGLNVTAETVKWHLDISMWRHEHIYYPACMKTLKGYLEKRRNQVNRKVKPTVRLLHKAKSVSGGSRMICLATGFYPRHIDLTLFRDGQPVADHEITGGDLLPNDDGTYQMKKILEISEEEQREKHKYTCTATHVSLDNKLNNSLEFVHGKPLKSVISILTILAFVIVIATLAAVIIWRQPHAASESNYSSASTSEERVDTPS